MSYKRILKQIIGINNIKIKSAILNEDLSNNPTSLYIYVDLYKRDKSKCTHCGKKLPGYDTATVDRKWRCTDINGVPIYLVYTIASVNCSEHGIVVESVPWALTGSRFSQNL